MPADRSFIDDLGTLTAARLCLYTAARLAPENWRDDVWELPPEHGNSPMQTILRAAQAQHQAAAANTVGVSLGMAKTVAGVDDRAFRYALPGVTAAREVATEKIAAAIRRDWRRPILQAFCLPVSPWPFVPGALKELDRQVACAAMEAFLRALRGVDAVPVTPHG